MAGHDVLGVELLVQCRGCGAHQPVNSPAITQRCTSCLGDFPVGGAVWTALVGGARGRLARLGRGVLDAGKLDRPGRDAEWEVGPDSVACDACGGATRLTPNALTCVACGRAIPVEPAPDHLRSVDPAVIGVVVRSEPEPETPKKLAMACVSCGAALELDEVTERTHPCVYCQTTNVISDDIWRALHPPRKRKRWWIVLRIDDDARTATPTPKSGGLVKSLAVLLLPAGFLGILLGGGIHWLLDRASMTAELSSSLPYILPVFLVLWLVMAVLLSLAHFRRKACIVPDNELAGRLAGWTGGKATVELVDREGRIVDRGSLAVDSDTYRKLGGDGSHVRAWRDPRTRWVEIEAVPSALR